MPYRRGSSQDLLFISTKKLAQCVYSSILGSRLGTGWHLEQQILVFPWVSSRRSRMLWLMVIWPVDNDSLLV